MNLEEHTRTHLDDLTSDVVGGPDLATAIRNGRRRRRSRVSALAVSGLAVAAVAVGVTAHQLQQPTATVEVTPATQPPAYQDFVPGTDVDETIQATIASDLAGLTPASKVYPTDWNDNAEPDSPASEHGAGLPDSEALNATQWNAIYTVDPNEDLVVQISKAVPGWPLRPSCSEISVSPGQPTCTISPLADGGRVASYGFFVKDSPLPENYWFLSVYTAPDGSTVNVAERVAADSWPQAEARRVFTVDQASTLASDTALTFPDPVVTPPAPAGP